ncbi:MAG: hypothetical protein K9N06_12635 [Candidatus Cloacimonetes bacterium]|nr:hypothetical protein [Candidatus Cloacimonadota bacterium]
MKKKITISLVVLVIGIVLIIVSQTVSFTQKRYEKLWGGYTIPYSTENKDLKNGILYGGIALFAISGISLAVILGKTKKDDES